MNQELLHAQLQHHWAGANGGVAFFDRVGRTHGDPAAAAEIRLMADVNREDRETLRRIMLSLGAKPSRLAATTARTGEWLARFKPNGRVVRRSPLTDVLEVEALRLAVSGKRIGWQFLTALAEHDSRLDRTHLDALVSRADEQLKQLHDIHLRVALERVLE